MQLIKATPIARHLFNSNRFKATFPIRTFVYSSIPSMPPKDKYTDPELRDEVKEEIHNGDKGGAPGQWSARKAQMMAAEYKKRGGGVRIPSSHPSSKHTDTTSLASTQPTKKTKTNPNNTSPNGAKKTGKQKKAQATPKTLQEHNIATSPKKPGKT
jgi:hypothetical protein